MSQALYIELLELAEKCVWVEILSFYGFNLLISNCCFAPDTTVDTFKRYFVYLEYVLDTHNFCVLLLGDFSLPLFKGKLELSRAVSQYYNKLIHFFLHMFTRLISTKLFPQQWQLVWPCVFLISLIFLLTMLYMCLCPLILTTLLFFAEVLVSIRKSNHSSNVSFRKHSSGD